ncbi:hypothetical protein Afe04nite_74640 [Asanoa ferruginea]|nr:hypothetical protein Afe04nite_74640 [Asanoa ferruginea]
MVVADPPPAEPESLAGPEVVAADRLLAEPEVVADPPPGEPEVVAADPLPAESELVGAGADAPPPERVFVAPPEGELDPSEAVGAEPDPPEAGAAAPAVAGADLALEDLDLVVDFALGADPDGPGSALSAAPLAPSGVTVAAAPTLPPGRADVTIGAPAGPWAPLPVAVSVSGRVSTPAGADSVGCPVVCSASPVGRFEPATGGATSWDTGLLNTSRSTDRIGPATPALARWWRSVPGRGRVRSILPVRPIPPGQAGSS